MPYEYSHFTHYLDEPDTAQMEALNEMAFDGWEAFLISSRPDADRLWLRRWVSIEGGD